MTGSGSGRDDENSNYPTVVNSSEYEWTHVAPSTAIIELIAEQSHLEPTEMKPLYGSVDPAALNTLIRGNGMGVPDEELTVSLTYAGFDVLVRSSGRIELYEAD